MIKGLVAWEVVSDLGDRDAFERRGVASQSLKIYLTPYPPVSVLQRVSRYLYGHYRCRLKSDIMYNAWCLQLFYRLPQNSIVSLRPHHSSCRPLSINALEM